MGYTSKISATQLESYQNQGYPNDAYIGSDGIERSLEDQLSPYIQYRQGTRAVVTVAPIELYEDYYDIEPYGNKVRNLVAAADVYSE